MDIVTLLEKLANSTHLKINDVLTLFPNDVRDALLKNNNIQLKKIIGNIENMADRSMVVQLPNNT